MELEVQREKKLDDGLHHGIIIDVLYRTEPYAYTDVKIELADTFVVTAGYPTCITKSSKLGLLLERFGAIVQEGSMLDPNKVLVGKDVQFQTITKGKYAEVLTESLKPNIKEETIRGN